MSTVSNSLIDALRQSLPPTFSRQVAAQHLGGLISAGRLANLDSMGQGPGGVRFGKRVAYEKEAFLAWLSERLGTDHNNFDGGRAE